MKRNTLLAAMTLTATVLGGAAFADTDYRHGNKSGAKSATGFMQDGGHGMDGMDGMMGMMQRMHGGMMGGMIGGMGPMGGDMMQMFDANGDGTVSPDEMRMQLQTKLSEYDSNGDGTLSIAEFEALHSATIREKMVDRFQYLDADGDGVVTAEEMAAPAELMERMQMMRTNLAQQPGERGNGMGMNGETKKHDN